MQNFENDPGFWGGFFGWLHWQEKDAKNSDFTCKECGKYVPSQKYNDNDGLCNECFKR